MSASTCSRYARRVCARFTAAIVLCAALNEGARASGTEEGFGVEEVAPGVYVHLGRHVDIDSPLRADMANTGFIVGKDCVAVIDPGGSVANGRRLERAIRAHTDTPVCYVILSHIHFDHVLGASPFTAGADVEVVGHRELPAAIAANRPFFQENFSAELGDDPALAIVVEPTITVGGEREIDLGGRVLRLSAHPLAHTNTDLMVLDRQTGTLFAGDLVFRERIPVVDGSATGWLDVLAAVDSEPVERVVPGHGRPAGSWEEATQDVERYLEVLVRDTRSAVADGLFIEEAKDVVGAAEKERWLLFDENHRRNVSRTFLELEWE